MKTDLHTYYAHKILPRLWETEFFDCPICRGSGKIRLWICLRPSSFGMWVTSRRVLYEVLWKVWFRFESSLFFGERMNVCDRKVLRVAERSWEWPGQVWKLSACPFGSSFVVSVVDVKKTGPPAYRQRLFKLTSSRFTLWSKIIWNSEIIVKTD